MLFVMILKALFGLVLIILGGAITYFLVISRNSTDTSIIKKILIVLGCIMLIFSGLALFVTTLLL